MPEKHLYFLRHGIALPRGSPGIAEWDRPLTPEGRKRLIRSVKGMKRIKLTVEAILSSPLPRAYQTAELLLEHLPFAGMIEIREELAPGGNWPALLNQIRSRKETHILLAGHEPDLSTAIGKLIGGKAGGSVLLKKGALASVRLEESSAGTEGQLQYLLQPKILRRLG